MNERRKRQGISFHFVRPDVYKRQGYKGAVTLYNAGGEKVIQINLSSTFLVDAAPSPDGRTVAAVAIDSDGGSFRSRVLFYQVNQKEPSLEVSLNGSSVLDMRYTDSGLWVLGAVSYTHLDVYKRQT